MSDGEEKGKSGSGQAGKINRNGSEELRKHNQDQQRQREEWAKIEKRGAGAGDRPKRD